MISLKKINISLSFWKKKYIIYPRFFRFWPNKNTKPIYILQ